MKKNRLVLTGGGTAGHVVPHIALLPGLRQQNWELLYIGSEGIEKSLMQAHHIPFKAIAVGKLRRYFSWQNFTDCFRLLLGIWQAFWILRAFAPQVVFSKGGFVSVPVAIAAWLLRIPVLTHEADFSVGLANKIIMRFADQTLYTFSDTRSFIPGKAELTGLPLRNDLHEGSAEVGKKLCGFPEQLDKPVLLIVGGSSGAQRINDAVSEILPELLQQFYVVHIFGSGKKTSTHHSNYATFGYVNEEYKHLLALADLAISRAGANAIFELASLKKAMLLIPLSQGSRGDQLQNARYFEKQGWAFVLQEKELSRASLLDALNHLLATKAAMQTKQGEGKIGEGTKRILAIIASYQGK